MTIIEEARALADEAKQLAELMQGNVPGYYGRARILLPQLAAALNTLATKLEQHILDMPAKAEPEEPAPLWTQAIERVKEARLLRKVIVEYRTMGLWDHAVAISARARLNQLQDALEEIA